MVSLHSSSPGNLGRKFNWPFERGILSDCLQTVGGLVWCMMERHMQPDSKMLLLATCHFVLAVVSTVLVFSSCSSARFEHIDQRRCPVHRKGGMMSSV